MVRSVLVLLVTLCLAIPALAQDNAATLADIRQQLTVLNVEMKKLKRELSTTGGASVNVTGNTVLDRVNAMESELARVTAKAEELEFRINSIVEDGTRRIGDLEFRLVELEGGDVGALGETSTLGGDDQESTSAPAPVQEGDNGQSQLAVSEAADFERAKEALAAGSFRAAADQFAAFNQTYPGGPLAAEADLRRGEALSGLGDVREAARAYLSSFGAAPVGPHAPEALYQLGKALGALGQTQEACVTLAEVGNRFADAPQVAKAEAERRTLGCN